MEEKGVKDRIKKYKNRKERSERIERGKGVEKEKSMG